MIDPNFWQSQDVARLTIRQRLLAIGLFSIADDEGRGVANPAYVRSQVFAYDDFTTKEIADDLEVIAEGLEIDFYVVGGNRYYAWRAWTKWQRVDKPRASMIPGLEMRSENDSRNGSENGSQTDSGLKEEKIRVREEKEKEEGASAATEPNFDDNLEPDGAQAYRLTEGEFGRPLSPIEGETVYQLAKEHGYDLFREALRRAVIQGKKSLRYAQRILESWRTANLQTLAEVLAYEEQHAGKPRAPTDKPLTEKRRKEIELIKELYHT